MKDKVILIQFNGSEPVEVDATALHAALCELRNAWRDDKGTFSVRVMQAFGAVIAETEVAIDFDTREGALG